MFIGVAFLRFHLQVTPLLSGQLCNFLTALWEKESFLTANLNLPMHNTRPSPLQLL